MRVVSVNCSNTEIVWFLGRADLLVGVDDHSDWPEELVAGLPRVGRDLEIDPERVAALSPDLVLASLTVPGHERVVASLEAAGLRVHAPETVTLEDVYRDVRDIGQLLDADEVARRVVTEMRAAMPSVDPGGHRPTVMVQWWPKPFIAPGRLSWVHDLIELAGGRNALDEEVKSRPLSAQEVARLDPEVIVVSWCGVRPSAYRPERVSSDPALAGVRAVRDSRVICVPEAYLGRPSPRLVDGYRALRDVLGGWITAGRVGS